MLNSSRPNKAEFIQESRQRAENEAQLCVAEVSTVKMMRKFSTHIPLEVFNIFFSVK